MGYLLVDKITGGLHDSDFENERPASFGPVRRSLARPTVTFPPNLRRDPKRRNNVRPSCHIITYSQVLTLGEQLVRIVPHTNTEFSDEDEDDAEDDADTNHVLALAFSCDRDTTQLQHFSRGGLPNERSNSQVPQSSSKIKPPVQKKLKIRATAQSQRGNPSKELTNALDAEYFVRQRSWAKVFLPTLMYLFFISEHPFQDFVNNTPSFVAIVQEAFNATHPNTLYTVTAGDAIVTTVSLACILGTLLIEVTPYPIRRSNDSNPSAL